MDLPVIPTPVFPRWVWMEEVTYSHIPIATVITAFLVLAPIYEYIGYRKNDWRYDRLAKSLVFIVMLLYSPGAALGTGIPMFIIGLYPEFWHRFANLYFWPLIAQFCFFLLDVFFLFFFYYLMWDRLQHRKRLHIFFGVMTAIFGLLIQAVWDSMGSYQLTPSTPFPELTEAVGWSAAAFFNPSYPLLFFHRFFGNLSYTMLLAGGVLALRYRFKKDAAEKSYFGWAADVTFTVGILAFFFQPVVGWAYASVMQKHASVAFHAVMGGHVSVVFTVKMALIAFFLAVGGTYLFVRHKPRFWLMFATMGLIAVYVLFHVHPPLDWLGDDPVLWRLSYTLVIGGAILFLWMARRWRLNDLGRRWPLAMFAAGLAAVLVFGIGGFVRSRARSPFSVYKEIVKPEVTADEADRFLAYEKCLGCHTAEDFETLAARETDWERRVALERERPGVSLTDEEALRITRYLKERYPNGTP